VPGTLLCATFEQGATGPTISRQFFYPPHVFRVFSRLRIIDVFTAVKTCTLFPDRCDLTRMARFSRMRCIAMRFLFFVFFGIGLPTVGRGLVLILAE